MKIMNILPIASVAKNGKCVESFKNENYDITMSISDPLLADLDNILKYNNCELAGYLTSDEMAIANTILGLARGSNSYFPSLLITALANHILAKAESVKSLVQLLPDSVPV